MPTAVHGVNNAEALHTILPQALEFTLQGFAGARFIAQGPDGGFTPRFTSGGRLRMTAAMCGGMSGR